MTSNVDSRVKDSCNGWACCLWCCSKSSDVQEPVRVEPQAPAPTPAPSELVRTVAMRQLKDVPANGSTEIHFDAVHLTVHYTPTLTPQVTPEHSIQE